MDGWQHLYIARMDGSRGGRNNFLSVKIMGFFLDLLVYIVIEMDGRKEAFVTNREEAQKYNAQINYVSFLHRSTKHSAKNVLDSKFAGFQLFAIVEQECYFIN